MKRWVTVLFLFAALYLVSCAGTVNYPISLSYQPQKQFEKASGASVTVAQLTDKRAAADKRAIGTKEGGIPFIALLDEPAAALSKGLGDYMKNRGYAVNGVKEEWDGDVRSLNPGWGDIVVGGTLDDLTLNVKGNLFKTEYYCMVKFTLAIADAKSREPLHKEKFEVSNSYVTVSFSREKAEELINQALSDAVERGLADIDRYIKK
ncbi:MAG: hypothetical protein HQL08_07370 [Nitrospirae bacterium]|nr:hypothetical protein [Nitrospirota bacterium]